MGPFILTIQDISVKFIILFCKEKGVLCTTLLHHFLRLSSRRTKIQRRLLNRRLLLVFGGMNPFLKPASQTFLQISLFPSNHFPIPHRGSRDVFILDDPIQRPLGLFSRRQFHPLQQRFHDFFGKGRPPLKIAEFPFPFNIIVDVDILTP